MRYLLYFRELSNPFGNKIDCGPKLRYTTSTHCIPNLSLQGKMCGKQSCTNKYKVHTHAQERVFRAVRSN